VSSPVAVTVKVSVYVEDVALAVHCCTRVPLAPLSV
jgi:hypothetical protein